MPHLFNDSQPITDFIYSYFYSGKFPSNYIKKRIIIYKRCNKIILNTKVNKVYIFCSNISIMQLELKLLTDSLGISSYREQKQLLISEWFSDFQNTAAQLIPTNSYPANLKTKAVYFVKKAKLIVPKENISKCIILGDLSPKPVEQLAALVDEVFIIHLY